MKDILHEIYVKNIDTEELFANEKDYNIICNRIQELMEELYLSLESKQKKLLTTLLDWQSSKHDIEIEGEFKMGMKYGAELTNALLSSKELSHSQMIQLINKLNLIDLSDL